MFKFHDPWAGEKESIMTINRYLRARTLRTGAVFVGAGVMSAGAAAAWAGPVGFASSDRFGYTGTIQRFNSLADAQAGANAIDTIAVGDRDMSLFVAGGGAGGVSDHSVVMGSWWYTTDEQGRAGHGNTRGNTGVGFMQLFDDGAATRSSLDMSFSNFNGTHYTDFNFSMTGENAGASEHSRLSAIDNVNDGGTFHSYALDMTVTGLQGVDDGSGLISAVGQPADVEGSFTGIFEITETQTSSDNLGFFVFNFDITMINWAYENRDDLMTQDENGDPIADTFPDSHFIAAAVIPLPGPAALSGLGLVAVGAIRRRRV